MTEIQGGFAEAQLLYNPNTGEMIKSGIIVDSDLMRYGKFDSRCSSNRKLQQTEPCRRVRASSPTARRMTRMRG